MPSSSFSFPPVSRWALKHTEHVQCSNICFSFFVFSFLYSCFVCLAADNKSCISFLLYFGAHKHTLVIQLCRVLCTFCLARTTLVPLIRFWLSLSHCLSHWSLLFKALTHIFAVFSFTKRQVWPKKQRKIFFLLFKCFLLIFLLTQGMYFSFIIFSSTRQPIRRLKEAAKKFLCTSRLHCTSFNTHISCPSGFFCSPASIRERSWSNYNKQKEKSLANLLDVWETTMLRWDLERRREFPLRLIFKINNK